MFLKIPLNAFFDVLDVNFCPPRIRSRPRHFPRLKTQITSSWENRLSWATSSRGAIPIENLAHFRDPPTRQTAEYYPIQRQTRFQSGKQTCFSTPKAEIDLFNGAKTDRFAATKTARFYPSKNVRKWAVGVRRVLVFLQVGRLRCPAAATPAAGHPSLRSGRPRQAHVFPPQSPWIARLSCSFYPLSANKAAARGAALTRLRLPAFSACFLIFV